MPPEIPRNVDTVFYFTEHTCSTKEGRKEAGFFAKTCKIVLYSVDSAQVILFWNIEIFGI